MYQEFTHLINPHETMIHVASGRSTEKWCELYKVTDTQPSWTEVYLVPKPMLFQRQEITIQWNWGEGLAEKTKFLQNAGLVKSKEVSGT